MAKFALICEGVTDQITISNILCGFFDNENLDEDIAFLQPPYDVTTQKQKYGEFGGMAYAAVIFGRIKIQGCSFK
ncbi:MAG: hypothetical protein F6K30_30375 [Cyanothece sp. SIO2G6]|nr:hypothetical protein [Cyanothece sp. SIO2G6]